MPTVPIAKVVERKFPVLKPSAFPSTADTIKQQLREERTELKDNVTPLSWWRRMVGKKAG